MMNMHNMQLIGKKLLMTFHLIILWSKTGLKKMNDPPNNKKKLTTDQSKEQPPEEKKLAESSSFNKAPTTNMNPNPHEGKKLFGKNPVNDDENMTTYHLLVNE